MNLMIMGYFIILLSFSVSCAVCLSVCLFLHTLICQLVNAPNRGCVTSQYKGSLCRFHVPLPSHLLQLALPVSHKIETWRRMCHLSPLVWSYLNTVNVTLYRLCNSLKNPIFNRQIMQKHTWNDFCPIGVCKEQDNTETVCVTGLVMQQTIGRNLQCL